MNASEIADYLKVVCRDFERDAGTPAVVTHVDESGHCRVYISNTNPCYVDKFDKILKHRIHTFSIESVDDRWGFTVYLRYYKPIDWSELFAQDPPFLKSYRESIENPVKVTKKWITA